jgi:hypothetical protein
MSKLSTHARHRIHEAGLTIPQYTRHATGDPTYKGRWGGDSCGCPDDRCIDYHHGRYESCGCLESLLAEAVKS